MEPVFGILVACYVQIYAGHWGWLEGREIGERGDKIYFIADGHQAEYVNNNDCNYLEDPVKAYERVMKQKEVLKQQERQHMKENHEKTQKVIDKHTIGELPWCLVDEYGRRKCIYMEQSDCLKDMNRISFCQQKELGD